MARYDRGWIKLYRTAVEGDLGQNAFVLAIWITLLSWATRHEQKLLLDGRQQMLPPGSVVFGMRELATKMGCSKSTVSKWLRYLESSERIALEVRPRGCVATIRNWKEYQEDEREGQTNLERSAAAEWPTGGQWVAPNGEVKKERRERELSLLPENIGACEIAWGKTLQRYQIQRNPSDDRLMIARLIQRHGFDKTVLALLGAGFEEKSKDYDPSKHVSINRLARNADLFDKFVNLGAQHKPTERKTQEWGV